MAEAASLPALQRAQCIATASHLSQVLLQRVQVACQAASTALSIASRFRLDGQTWLGALVLMPRLTRPMRLQRLPQLLRQRKSEEGRPHPHNLQLPRSAMHLPMATAPQVPLLQQVVIVVVTLVLPVLVATALHHLAASPYLALAATVSAHQASA